MNLKNFTIGGIAGGIVYFLLGWLFYGILFEDIYPPSENHNLSLIFLACITFAFFVSYIFNKWAHITTVSTGTTAGSIIGFFYGLTTNLFMYANIPINATNMALDIVITIFMSAIIGGVIGLVSGKLR